MRQALVRWILLTLTILPAWAQQDPLQGRWEGMARSSQGERKVTVSFKKEGDAYTGVISGVGGGTEVPFKEVKLEGEKGSAKLQVDAPQGAVVVNFDFVVKGEALEGKGEINLGTQVFNFTYDLKRVGDLLVRVEQTPEQKLEYFVGQWNFEMTSRESPLGPGGALKGTMSFQKVLDGKFLETFFDGAAEGAGVQGGGYIGYDAGNKVYIFFESRKGGVALLSVGTWTGPGIRLETAPLKIQDQTFRVRRAISIVSETTFTVKQEMSLDGGPFQRLSNGTFTKVAPTAATKTDPK